MVKLLKRTMPGITLVVVALLVVGVLAACDIFDTKAPDEDSNGDGAPEVAGDGSPESDLLPGDDDFTPENGGAVLGAPGSYNIFVQITGINGESVDEAHEDWIDVLSYSHSISRDEDSDTSRTTGHGTHQDFIITKELDKASPKLALYCSNSIHIEEVTIELCFADGDQDRFMEIVLEDVVVTSVIVNGTAGSEDRPVEEVSFAYGHIYWTYTEYDEGGMPMGNVEAHWNVETDTGG